MIDKKPIQLVVKLKDDAFAKALDHFRQFLPGAEAMQVVQSLGRRRSNPERTLRMLPVADYLASVAFGG